MVSVAGVGVGVVVVVVAVVAAMCFGLLLPAGFALALLLAWEADAIAEWNVKQPRRAPSLLGGDSEELHPLRMHAIAETARQMEGGENATLFKFVNSCKKVSYEALKALVLVDVEQKTLPAALARMPAMEQQIRRDFLRNIAKKLTHPLFGITPSTKEDKYRGFEIVEWLASNLGLQRKHAVELGIAMQASGMILPLKRLTSVPGKKRIVFGDKMRNWRFDYAAIDKDWPAQREKLKRGKSAASSTDASVALEPTPGTSIVNARKASSGVVEEDTTVIMGAREWNYLFASGTTETFSEGREIVSAGASNENLFRIVQGSVKVSEVDKKKKILGEDAVFGEESASYLTGSSVSRISVVAHTTVTVQLIDSVSLAKLLLIEPAVCKVTFFFFFFFFFSDPFVFNHFKELFSLACCILVESFRKNDIFNIVSSKSFQQIGRS